MTTLELKKNFHHLIDSIDNEQLLSKFYDILKSCNAVKDGDLWSRLTNQEQDELISAFNESEKEKYLISHDRMMKKHKKWL
jgi:hypothetical protein